MCPVSDGDYEESYIWGNEKCYPICRYYGCTFSFVNVQTWQPMSEKWFISYKLLFWVQLSWCKSCSWGWYENWGHNHDGEHIWSWYVSHALPLAWKLWNPLSIYNYFQSWIGHGMSSSKNKVRCMVIIFIKHFKDNIAWYFFNAEIALQGVHHESSQRAPWWVFWPCRQILHPLACVRRPPHIFRSCRAVGKIPAWGVTL